jgi:thymidylate synthase ThyX
VTYCITCQRVNMTTISATTILRSRHALDPSNVITTLLLRYPRPIHAEFMTHRVFSRNAASSRAIPVAKLIQDVIDNPYIPLHWGKNEPGMQASAQFEGADREWLIGQWLMDRDHAVERARVYAEFGCHKQIVNRLLEPFAHITVVVSGTEWSNFVALRDHSDAEPHIQMLAAEVRKCLKDESTIQTLQPGDWHLPFVDDLDRKKVVQLIGEGFRPVTEEQVIPLLRKLSTARCASTSYKTVDGFDMTLEKATALHDSLVAAVPLHASPTEHQARADSMGIAWANEELRGNFRPGWVQYRKTLPGESQ